MASPSLTVTVQSMIQGEVDRERSHNTWSAIIDATSAGGLIPGQPVKIVQSTGGIFKVVEAAASTDDICGFINYDGKKTSFKAGDRVELSMFGGNVMWMTASAAIARMAQVMVVISGVKVATAAGTGNRIVGIAADAAAANGDLIPVYITLSKALVP